MKLSKSELRYSSAEECNALEEPLVLVPNRKLRTFDVEAIAPYDNKGLVAFMAADKLAELTPQQVRVFMLLRDTAEAEGLTKTFVAERLDIPNRSACDSLRVLKRLGYARHSDVDQYDANSRKVTAWVYDPTHWFSDEDFLYWEFGELFPAS